MSILDTESESQQEHIPTVEVDSLTRVFDVPGGEEVAVDNISFKIVDGEFLTIVGPSGCGKTTTLRCVAGLETPSSGSINIDGKDITKTAPNNRDIAMIFQDIALYPHMRIKDNISYPLKIDGVPPEERYERAREVAELMEVEELLEKYPGELSGGQQQRAALARTIIQEPTAFLLDEPLSDLDAKLKVAIRKEIQRAHRYVRRPTIYVTHDQEEAMTMSDRIAIMNDGRIEQIDTPDRVYEYPENTFVARFIGNPTINFFQGTLTSLTEGEGSVDIHGESFAFTADYLANQSSVGNAPEEVTIGVRPTDINLEKKGGTGVTAEIQLLERIDNRVLTTLDRDGEELRAFLPSGAKCKEGDTVSLSFNENNLHIFDASSDELLVKTGT